ncbi:hypothetical protein [Flavobacterium sp. SORGH_AS_0622]|uniref:hypothetical protein n=1 Tax=Flavobacterium sp. SORGH_AS_0622 TaxID=3041772 RepID=UPI0027D92477|nr:hypothetical protein [Flavobacterium sp. SORGH_AS_0622]
MSLSMLATGLFANESLGNRKISDANSSEIQYFENGYAITYGCTVYIAWHDSHGSYSNTWSFPNVNTLSGCQQMLQELLDVLQATEVVELPAFPEDPNGEPPVRFTEEETNP